MKLTDYITYIEPLKRFRPHWTAKLGEIEDTGSDREEATKNLFIPRDAQRECKAEQ